MIVIVETIRDEAAVEMVNLNEKVLYGFCRASHLPQDERDTVHS